MSERKTQQSSFSRLQTKLVGTPFPMFFGPPSVVAAYCEMELVERSVAQETLDKHAPEVSLWYRGLKLLREPMFGEWNIPDNIMQDETAMKAVFLRGDILGLEVSSAKSALDQLVSGYYSIAFAAIRHMLEAFTQLFYITVHPEQARIWYDHERTPGMAEMMKEIKGHANLQRGDGFDPRKYDSLYDACMLMSKGSHPTGSGLTQVLPELGSNIRMLGAVYRSELAYVGFDNGLFAVTSLLEALKTVKDLDDAWQSEFDAWYGEVQDWRMTLLEIEDLQENISEAKREAVAQRMKELGN